MTHRSTYLRHGGPVWSADPGRRDADRINAAREALTQASHKMATAMYGQGGGGAGPTDAGATGGDAGAAAGGQAGGDKPKDDGEVIDAEFEEKN